MINKLKNNWLFYIIVLQPILDILAYFTFSTKITFVSFITRTIILLFIVIYCFYKSNNKKSFILKMLPVILFFILHFLNIYRIGFISIFTDLRYFICVWQVPILTISFIDYLKNNHDKENQIRLGMIINIFIICISLIVAIFTNSYSNTYEGYGLTGWFTSANTQSMILVAICPLFIYYFNRKTSVVEYLFSHIILVFLLYFNGTKACFMSLIVILIVMSYVSFFNKYDKFRIKKSFISLTILVLVILTYKYSFASFRNNALEDVTQSSSNSIEEKLKEWNVSIDDINKLTKEQTIELLKTSYYFSDMIADLGEDNVYEVMKGNISASNLTNNRFRKKMYAKIIYNNSDFMTKLFGFEYTSIEQYQMNLENDFTAIFYYYGYVGFSIYLIYILYFIYIMFYKLIKDKKNIINGDFIVLSSTLLLILVGGEYTGAFLRKSNANIYLAIILSLIYLKCTITKTRKKTNKIKFLLLHLGYGGIETSTINTANALSKYYNIELVSFYNLKENQQNKINKNVKITYLYNGGPNKKELKEAYINKNIFKLIYEGIKSIDILLKKKILIIKEIMEDKNCIIVSTRMEFSVLLNKYARRRQTKIAIEHQHHNNNRKYINTIKHKYYNIDYLFALTDSLKKDYELFLKHNHHTKVCCVPNMIISDFDKISTLNNKTLISVGRLHEGKKISDLIDIFNMLEDKSIKLNIIGDGDEYEKLNKQINVLNLQERVFLLGYKSKDEIEKYLIKSDIFLMTSITEGLPMVLLEAMSYGVPCIAFETDSGVKDIIGDNKNGFIIKNRDKKEYADKINKLLNNQKLKEKFSKNAIIRAKEFSENNVVKTWLEILNYEGEL